VVFKPVKGAAILCNIIDARQPVAAVVHKLDAGAAIARNRARCQHRVAIGIVGKGKTVQRRGKLIQENDVGDFAGDCPRRQVVLEFTTAGQEG
jgi:hypothetical protein